MSHLNARLEFDVTDWVWAQVLGDQGLFGVLGQEESFSLSVGLTFFVGVACSCFKFPETQETHQGVSWMDASLIHPETLQGCSMQHALSIFLTSLALFPYPVDPHIYLPRKRLNTLSCRRSPPTGSKTSYLLRWPRWIRGSLSLPLDASQQALAGCRDSARTTQSPLPHHSSSTQSLWAPGPGHSICGRDVHGHQGPSDSCERLPRSLPWARFFPPVKLQGALRHPQTILGQSLIYTYIICI